MGYLVFKTEKEAIAEEAKISKKKGFPKYGLRKDGTPNRKVIIDKWDTPFKDEEGNWCIKDPSS